MNSSKLPDQKKALIYTTIFVFLFSLWFLRDFFSIFVISGTLTYLFYPLYKHLNKKLSNSLAISLTVVCSLLIIVVPLIITLTLAGLQLSRVSQSMTPYFSNLDTNLQVRKSIDNINSISSKLPFGVSSINTDTLVNGLQNMLISFGNWMLSFLTSFLGSFISTFTSFIVFIFMFVSLLKNGEHLLEMFRNINPLGRELSNLYIDKVGAMVKGTVRGQFAIALTQGILGAIAFTIAGFGNFFFVIFAVFTLLSIIPLGAGILAIPAGVIMILFGNIWGGVVVIAEHILINTNVDNILRPILVPKSAKLDPTLMLVSVFAGIRLFGFLGIIIGPTLMILVVTTINAYLEFIKVSKHQKAKSKA